MARDYTPLLLTLWDDRDWLNLTGQQHDVYTALLASKDLSWCGVAPLVPQRLAAWSADLTLKKVQTALTALADPDKGKFIVVDDDTGEICVRSFIRHGRILKQPKVVVAMLRALEDVRSKIITDTITHELRRIYGDDPTLRGWQVVESRTPVLFRELSTKALRKAS